MRRLCEDYGAAIMRQLLDKTGDGGSHYFICRLTLSCRRDFSRAIIIILRDVAWRDNILSKLSLRGYDKAIMRCSEINISAALISGISVNRMMI